MRTIFKKMALAGIAWFGFAGVGFAQPMSPQMEGYINEEVLPRRNGGAAPQNSGPSAAEIRAWHARERAVQERIARYRATPYWMALAWDSDKNTVAWPGGFSSEQRAIERAKQICSSPNCHVFATFNNTCAVLVKATDNPRSTKDLFIGINKDDVIAAEQAMKSCQAVYGVRKDRCFYTGTKTGKGLNGTAFCVGYDYSLYNQK